MSVSEDTMNDAVSPPKTAVRPKAPIQIRVLEFISSVRFGVFVLVLLVVLSFLGMIIVQQNVQGFDTFYASLTPAEKTVYGALGFFDIYHSWYFNISLLILSLNIILASIDRFPTAWSYISRPKKTATKPFLLRQRSNAVLSLSAPDEKSAAALVSAAMQSNGFKAQILEDKGKKYVFGESGKWNRIGAYIVHVFLLTLFLGHFVALQTGFDADVQLRPAQKTSEIELIRFNLDKQERYNVKLPFSITCTDIQQKLIDPKGSIEISNTLDWRTQIKIDDPQYGETIADVSLNKPYSYRGYRFFQASAITQGKARTMKLEAIPVSGGAPLIMGLDRNGEAALPDGTKIIYDEFWSDFVVGQEDSFENEYANPALRMKTIDPAGKEETGYAFAMKVPDDAPIGKPIAGYKWRLAEFEKVPAAHVLSIKYDPFEAAWIAWYLGGTGIMGSLLFVFFVSHRRIWALIERKADSQDFEVTFGGDSNRNHLGFEDKFGKVVNSIGERA